MAPLSTEVLYAGYGVLHELKAKWDLLTLCAKTYSQPHLQQYQSVAYPAVNLYIDGVKIAVGSTDIDELNQRSNTDALWRRERKMQQNPEKL